MFINNINITETRKLVMAIIGFNIKNLILVTLKGICRRTSETQSDNEQNDDTECELNKYANNIIVGHLYINSLPGKFSHNKED